MPKISIVKKEETPKQAVPVKAPETPVQEDAENSTVQINGADWKVLTHAPPKMVNPLMEIYGRIVNAAEREASKSLKNYLAKTANKLYDYAVKLDEDYTPPPPKTIDDALAWALSRNKDGTFLALMDKDGRLVKTMKISDQIEQDLGEVTFKEGATTVEMKTKLVIVGGFAISEVTAENPEGGKSVPQKVVKAVPFNVHADTGKAFFYKEA